MPPLIYIFFASSLRFSAGKDKSGSGNCGSAISAAPSKGSSTLPPASHNHGQQLTPHSTAIRTPQVNQQQPPIFHTNIMGGATSTTLFNAQNVSTSTVPLVPIVSAAPLPPEKLPSVTFNPNHSLPTGPSATVSVSTCSPVR